MLRNVPDPIRIRAGAGAVIHTPGSNSVCAPISSRPSSSASSTLPCTGQRTNASRRMNSQWIRARFHGSELRSYQRHFCSHSLTAASVDSRRAGVRQLGPISRGGLRAAPHRRLLLAGAVRRPALARTPSRRGVPRRRRFFAGRAAPAFFAAPFAPAPSGCAVAAARADRQHLGEERAGVGLRAPRRPAPASRWRSRWPPSSPPSGPRSMIWSATLITSRLCSITTTVLPASTSRWSTSSSRWMSAKCSPVVGSSRM